MLLFTEKGLAVINDHPLDSLLVDIRATWANAVNKNTITIPLSMKQLDTTAAFDFLEEQIFLLFRRLSKMADKIKLHSGNGNESFANLLLLVSQNHNIGEDRFTAFESLFNAVCLPSSDSVIWEEALKVVNKRRGSKQSANDKPTPAAIVVQVTEAEKAVFDDAWTDEYQHSWTIDHLWASVNGRLRRRDRYSNSFAIVQSSGMGKSRAMDELAKRCLTIPVCLRKADRRGEFSHPRPDHSVRDFLLSGHLDSSERKSLEVTADFFFAALFDYTATVLAEQFNASPQLANNVHDFFANRQNRTAFYTTIIDYARDACSRLDRTGTENVATSDKLCPGDSHPGVDLSLLINHDEEFREKIIKYKLDTLLGVVDRITSLQCGKSFLKSRRDQLHLDLNRPASPIPQLDSVKLLIVLDEADVLEDLSAITSLFHSLVNRPVYMVYLATTSSVSILAPTFELSRSARLHKQNLTLNAPYCGIPLRPFAGTVWPALMASDKKYLANFCQLKAAAALGRPLWNAIINRGRHDALLGLVYSKLFCDQGDHEETALSARLLLRTQQSHAGIRLASKLVAGHLAVAFHFSQDRHFFFAGYPPEPLVAAAATEYMITKASRQKLMDTLTGMLNLDMINRGLFGELVGRLWYLLARDDAFILDEHRSIPYLEPVSLIKYLECLVGSHPDTLKELFDVECITKNARTTLREFFADAVVYFASWCQADAKVDVFAWESLLAALAQCCAIQCTQNQKVVDFVIPVVLNPANVLDRSNIAVIAVQINQSKCTNLQIKSANIFPSNIPVIFLHHELDASSCTQKARNPKASAIRGQHVNYNLRSRASQTPVFQTVIYGINSQLIPKRTYDILLQSQEIEDKERTLWQGVKKLADGGVAMMHLQQLYGLSIDWHANSWYKRT